MKVSIHHTTLSKLPVLKKIFVLNLDLPVFIFLMFKFKAKLNIGDTLKGDLHNLSQRFVLIRDGTNYHCSTGWDEKEVLLPRTLIGSKELIIGSR